MLLGDKYLKQNPTPPRRPRRIQCAHARLVRASDGLPVVEAVIERGWEVHTSRAPVWGDVVVEVGPYQDGPDGGFVCRRRVVLTPGKAEKMLASADEEGVTL